MTRLEAIQQIVAKAHYADEPRVLRCIRHILDDEDPSLEIKDLENFENEVQVEYERVLLQPRVKVLSWDH